MNDIDWMLTAESGRAIRETLGKNLFRERERAGICQEDLAELSGVSRNTISRMEAGKQEPRFTTLLAISWALHVPVEALQVDLPVPPGLDRIGRRALARRPWLEK
jgi:DNA-binding XRE family transcriptional regulator